MERYKKYGVEELIGDASFRNWIREPQGASAPFWENWTRLHPEQAETVRQARDFIEVIQQKYTSVLNASEIREDVQQVVQWAQQSSGQSASR